MLIDLSGNIALVTGSTEGIGYAILEGYAESGADVIVNGRKEDKVNEAVAALSSKYPKVSVKGVAADLGNVDGVNKLIAAVPHVDILVNAVGVVSTNPVLEEDDETFFRLFEINLMSSVRMCRAYVPKMIENNKGRVLFCGSTTAMIGSMGGPYPMTKSGQMHFARSVADLTRGSEVTVNTLMIGPTHSASFKIMLESMAQDMGVTVEEAEKQFMAKHWPQSLLGRIVRSEEVANLAVYLSSPLASATNGAIMSADGGARNTVFS